MHPATAPTSYKGQKRDRSPGVSRHSSRAHHSSRGSVVLNASSSTSLRVPVHAATSTADMSFGDLYANRSTPTEPRTVLGDSKAAMHARERYSLAAVGEGVASASSAESCHSSPQFPVAPCAQLHGVNITGQGVPASMACPPQRPFGLQACPEYHPSAEQFQDPMAFIRSIAGHAKQFGVCKVVPPTGWRMPFVTDSENFPFKTRRQRLNSIEAPAWAKINFLERLFRFHKEQGHPRSPEITIEGEPVDLWTLRMEVYRRGGYEPVTAAGQWASIGDVLGYAGVEGAPSEIKNSYECIILPYEHHMARIKDTAMIPVPPPSAAVPPSPRVISARNHLSETVRDRHSEGSARPPSLAAWDIDGGAQAEGALSYPPRRTSWQERAEDSGTRERCDVCREPSDEQAVFSCDGCDCSFHARCLDPPLETAPKNEWFCFACISGSDPDAGFTQGEEQSLSGCRLRDGIFRRAWFDAHRPPAGFPKGPVTGKVGDVEVPDYFIEQEFWRLVHSRQETVEVEHGTDVHAMSHGSAMPTLESHPLDPYSKDPWNLNNISIAADSLLRYVRSDVSGMTTPWTSVGTTFAPLCWHSEDHYAYSIDFMHWGETKTWYSIPGDDADRFEGLLKREAPNLFEARPDVLFEILTLKSPKFVRDAGIPVYVCDQRAGEFLLTFPKSYRAGFSHGLNLCESVNFALPDWLPFNLECVQRFRHHKKLPAFSHDELLVTIAQQAPTAKTAAWLLGSLEEMTSREAKDRQRLRARGIKDRVESVVGSEERYRCAVCKALCYLSHVVCSCSPTHAFCADHVGALCGEESSLEHLSLRLQLSDDDMRKLVTSARERASAADNWRQLYRDLVARTARPPFKALKAMLAKGEQMGCDVPELRTLRRCVDRAGKWIAEASHFLQPQQAGRRRKRRGRTTASAAAPSGRGHKEVSKGLSDLLRLLGEVHDLGFDTPEISALRALANKAASVQERALSIVQRSRGQHNRPEVINEAKALLAHAASVTFPLQEVQAVQKVLHKEELMQSLEDLQGGDYPGLSLQQLRGLLAEARACGLATEHSHLKTLQAKVQEGDDWEQKVQAILHADVRNMADLEFLAKAAGAVPYVEPSVLDDVRALYSRARDYESQAGTWMSADEQAGEDMPTIADVRRFIDKVEQEFKIDAIESLKRAVRTAADLENRCKQVISHNYLPGEEDVFETISQWAPFAVRWI